MSIVRADREVCRGFANCVMSAPAYFDLDDDGLVVVKGQLMDEKDRAQVETAVNSCPVSALWIDES